LLARLESAVGKSEFVGKGKTLKINNKVDPSILGGLVVEIEGRTIDYSVSRKIAQMNHILTEAL
jgi:F-type H+-transporting ATPase subunit O